MPVESSKRETARRLRRTMTEAERRLWLDLKRIPVEGSHFRRQVPIGPFVADFACLAARLVVELDGGQHTEDAHALYDSRRSAWLAREGYRVIRFQNTEVIDRPDDVLDTIYAAVFGGPDAEAMRLRHRRWRRGEAPPRR